ncbi:disease resistance protein RPH8A-like [Salvia miltiorrhiza]|uniref:disease resistance protein RPH8A-like n=1 Tax=Salvia miltiorrhiza TaxID=226208 RepID=UPI0025ABC0AC|nr:disease resistance protein RPH8A-like [Salvia miltiorrhiza]
MAEAAISSLVELLGDQLIQKVKFLRGVEGKVESLKAELKRMQCFLEDANKKQFEDKNVQNWISEIREVAQDAEDTIEMFLINVENSKSKGLLKRCTRFARRMYELNRIGDEIESILAKIDAIDKSRERYGIKDFGKEATADSGWRLQVESRRRLSPLKTDEHLVGVEEDVKKLLEESILNEERMGLSIAVLEGMGGIGKSTLARAVYNHCDVLGRFDSRGWVVVSSEFTPQETIKQLIFQLQRSHQDKQKLLDEIKKLEESIKDTLFVQEELKQMLHKELDGKSYFIVLDDVWEKEHLESLMSAFPNQQDKTSRLLVTTRNKIVTKYDQYVHMMKLLDREKGWELLLKNAFIRNTNGKYPEEFESIGRQIVEKCHGLPLAISVVGGLLRETQSNSGCMWEQVLNQINSYLERTESSVPTILELSYHNLSPQLKSCFLCLAFFKEDSTIPAKRLINIWVGQGLIQQEGTRTTHEIARGCLNELINRSMLQVENLTIDNRVRTCRLHDLLREVCLRKAKEEIGLEIVKGEEGSSSQSSYKPRHRVVYGKNLEAFSRGQNKHLRSLFLLNVNGDSSKFYLTTPSRYWKRFQLLKMLDLDGFAFQRLPDSFRLLIGLKYLRIHRPQYLMDCVLELPSWLNDLKNLEVLDLENELIVFPNVALQMEKLRHFHIYSVWGQPMSIENWRNIESVKGMRLKDWLECSPKLMASRHVRELSIYMSEIEENNDLSMARASLEKMTNLVELHLKFNQACVNRTHIIPQLGSITKLKLYGGWMLECPDASKFPPNLTHLTLKIAKLFEDPMPKLGKLPKLQFLKVSEYAYKGWNMKVLCDGFPCLEALSLKNMLYLSSIDIEEGGMPHLKHLRIHKCEKLDAKNLWEHIKTTTVYN